MSTKTVCFFNSNRAWGGGEKWHYSTAQEFQRRGHRTLVVANVKSELEKKCQTSGLDVTGFFVNNLSFLNPIKVLTIMAFFRGKNVDAVVLNLPADLKLAGIAAKLAGVRTIIYRRGMPHPLRNTFLNRFLFKHVLTHVVVNSEEIGRSLREGNESWFPTDKLTLIYNGVNTALLPDPQRKVYEKSGSEVVLGNAGRLTEQKGQKYLIEMAELLKERGLKFKLLVAGEGELRSELKKMVTDYDLEHEVTFLGHVDDMTGFLNSLDIFVFPSLFEGSANTLIETLQHRIPCVAFDVSSNPEIIQHGQNGLLAKPFEVNDLADQVERLIKEPELSTRFVRRGEELLREKFDSSRNLDILEKVLG